MRLPSVKGELFNVFVMFWKQLGEQPVSLSEVLSTVGETSRSKSSSNSNSYSMESEPSGSLAVNSKYGVDVPDFSLSNGDGGVKIEGILCCSPPCRLAINAERYGGSISVVETFVMFARCEWLAGA